MTTHSGMTRHDALERFQQHEGPWDLVVIGGGATGVGIALDAATRGMSVVLVEQSDFGKGTSSRSTKLVHGGVRYLRQGNLTLVRDALRERTLLKENAPHLVHDLPFVIPCRSWWQRFFYGVGLKVYDFLAVGNSFGRSHGLSVDQAVEVVPALSKRGLRGGVVYHDGQFDDARLLISMVRTAHDAGGCLLNYMEVTDLLRDSDQHLKGVKVIDRESGIESTIHARAVVNAAGPFCDAIRMLDDPSQEKMIAPSQGVHLVLPRELFPGDTAMIVPKTSDGRVIFIIPWHEHAIVGTTDTPIDEATLEPTPQEHEIQFLLDTAADYMERAPKREELLGCFTGIRPLVKGDKSARTASLSRDHVIRISDSGLITISGGKWTTVRKMAEDCVDRAVKKFAIQAGPCKTKTMKLHGATNLDLGSGSRATYGSDLAKIEAFEQTSPELAEPLTKSLDITGAQVVWAVREEMARTVEDVLARRTRALFLDCEAAVEIAPAVARLIAQELDRDEAWCESQVNEFLLVAEHYRPQPVT
ncbi:MAG: FAD-dependent oxidoreductase [Rubripirellula sp.]